MFQFEEKSSNKAQNVIKENFEGQDIFQCIRKKPRNWRLHC